MQPSVSRSWKKREQPPREQLEGVIELTYEMSLWHGAKAGRGTHKSRNAARRSLIEHATETRDLDLWEEIGRFLLKVYDDLSYQVYDLFLVMCPDEAFARLMRKHELSEV